MHGDPLLGVDGEQAGDELFSLRADRRPPRARKLEVPLPDPLHDEAAEASLLLPRNGARPHNIEYCKAGNARVRCRLL